MLDGLAYLYEQVEVYRNLVWTHIRWVAAHIGSMAGAIGDGNFGLAAYQGGQAADDLYTVADDLAAWDVSSLAYTYDCFKLIDDNWPEVTPLTWKTIVEAWVKDDFEGRFWTIGVIDRMRQILWDEPFDITWAARPEEKVI